METFSCYPVEVIDRKTSERFKTELAASLGRELPVTEHVHHKHKGDLHQLEF